MQTPLEVEGLLATPPQSLTPAANEEFAASLKPVTGWDPYEVWRTRVKSAPDVTQSASPSLA